MTFSFQALIQRIQAYQASGMTEVVAGRFTEILEAAKKLGPADAAPQAALEPARPRVPENRENAENGGPASRTVPQNRPYDYAVKPEMKKKETKSALPVTAPQTAGCEDLAALAEMPDRVEALKILAAKVARCTRCLELVANRTQTVLGVGNPYAELMFVGEAPGADEDKQGVPFVGRAGKLLTDMIEKGMKISREEQTYVCNILRCRPPGNRTPLPVEAERCRPFLDAQISIVKPKFICCLGASAAQNLLNTTTTIGKLRGEVHDYRGIQVICTYHPAYLLRNPAQKVATWEDLKLLMKVMGIKIDN